MGFFSRKSKEQEEEVLPRRRTRVDDEIEQVQNLRRRARHRLLGALVLVVTMVVVLPMFFRASPKQDVESVSITIPSKSEAPQDLALAQIEPPVVHEESATVAQIPSQESTATSPVVSQAPSAQDQPKEENKVKLEAEKLAHEKKLKAEADKLEKDKKAKEEEDRKQEKEKQLKADRAKKEQEQQQQESQRVQALLSGGSSSNTANETKVEQGKKYALQIGAYSTRERADEVKSRVVNAGVGASVVAVKTSSGEVFRVRSQSFPSKSAAEVAKSKIKSAGLDSSLVPL